MSAEVLTATASEMTMESREPSNSTTHNVSAPAETLLHANAALPPLLLPLRSQERIALLLEMDMLPSSVLAKTLPSTPQPSIQLQTRPQMWPTLSWTATVNFLTSWSIWTITSLRALASALVDPSANAAWAPPNSLTRSPSLLALLLIMFRPDALALTVPSMDQWAILATAVSSIKTFHTLLRVLTARAMVACATQLFAVAALPTTQSWLLQRSNALQLKLDQFATLQLASITTRQTQLNTINHLALLTLQTILLTIKSTTT